VRNGASTQPEVILWKAKKRSLRKTQSDALLSQKKKLRKILTARDWTKVMEDFHGGDSLSEKVYYSWRARQDEG